MASNIFGIVSTDLRPIDDDFCREKADGWYPVQSIGYTQCVAGHLRNTHTCGISLSLYGAPKQCTFCPSSCSCDDWGCSKDYPDNRTRKCPSYLIYYALPSDVFWTNAIL